jgi:hypothetical protein
MAQRMPPMAAVRACRSSIFDVPEPDLLAGRHAGRDLFHPEQGRLPRIASVLAERQGTLTNDLAAAEDLKRQAVEAEEAYNKALADARAESQRIAEETRAEIQATTGRGHGQSR